MEFGAFLDEIGLDPLSARAVLSWNEEAEADECLGNLVSICRQAWSRTWRLYEEKGISREVFINTFRDIARWEEDYRERTGRPGLSNTRWLGNHLSLRLFAVGALQYQIPDEDCKVFTLYLHIPKHADISQPSVDESFSRALAFFKVDEMRLVCSSWLLSDELSSLLPPSSRIRSFSARFTHVADNYERRQAEERIFGALRDNPADYPVTSSLARSARDYLVSGGRLPVTTGYLTLRR